MHSSKAILAMLTGMLGLSAMAATTPRVRPQIFAPDDVPGAFDDGAAAFSADGRTVYFMRSSGDAWTVMRSDRRAGRWSDPRPATFSGHWRDLDPAMAPDGSYLLFVSNRPTGPGGRALDATFGGTRRAGMGMNLWRVDRDGAGWGRPVRLPERINRCPMTFAPSVAADGSVYFIGCARPDGDLRLMRATYAGGRYGMPREVRLGDAQTTLRDPAIAPDQSFIVVSARRDRKQPYRLAIAFRTRRGWSALQDLGDAVNGGKHSMGAQLGPDRRTLYFYSDRWLLAADPNAGAAWNNGDDHIWQVTLEPWLDAHARAVRISPTATDATRD